MKRKKIIEYKDLPTNTINNPFENTNPFQNENSRTLKDEIKEKEKELNELKEQIEDEKTLSNLNNEINTIKKSQTIIGKLKNKFIK